MTPREEHPVVIYVQNICVKGTEQQNPIDFLSYLQSDLVNPYFTKPDTLKSGRFPLGTRPPNPDDF